MRVLFFLALEVPLVCSDFTSSDIESVHLSGVNSNLKGFFGGSASANHAYYVPCKEASSGATVRHGYTARISLTDFTTTGVEYLNLAASDSDLVGFQGGVATADHMYFCPFWDASGARAGKLVRVSHTDFTSSGIEVLDIGASNSALVGFIDAFATANHVYLAPSSNSQPAYHGNAVRVSLTDFTSSGIENVNLQTVNTNLKGFGGGFATANHAYYCPNYATPTYSGLAPRVSLTDWTTSGVGDGMLPPMTTSAQAEGAIEGVYTDYKLPNTASTNFAYSRYHRTVGQPPKQALAKRTASTSEWDGNKRWAGRKREL